MILANLILFVKCSQIGNCKDAEITKIYEKIYNINKKLKKLLLLKKTIIEN